MHRGGSGVTGVARGRAMAGGLVDMQWRGSANLILRANAPSGFVGLILRG